MDDFSALGLIILGLIIASMFLSSAPFKTAVWVLCWDNFLPGDFNLGKAKRESHDS